MMFNSQDISVEELTEGQARAWAELLPQAGNATLFHSLDFLAYHPSERFDFHHLMVRRNGQLIAVVPGGLRATPDGTTFRSPLGASVGGPAVLATSSAADCQAIIGAVQTYITRQGWSGMDVVLAPSIYSRLQESLAFALHSASFSLTARWLCGIIDLKGPGPDRYTALFRSRNVTKTRASLRRGLSVQAGGRDALEKFGIVFDATYARHGVRPTHTLDELDDLMRRFPERIRIYLALHGSVPLAGLFVMDVAPQVATSFYICKVMEQEDLHANLALFAHVIDELADRGFHYLDLGPMSMDDGRLNPGVAFFKEGLGAFGSCRDLWSWRVSHKDRVEK